jgi:HAD superfamily hydrolase (TIGR01509 family)
MVIRGVLFDRDGVLLEPNDETYDHFVHWLASYGPTPSQVMREVRRVSEKQLEKTRNLEITTPEAEKQHWLESAQSLLDNLDIGSRGPTPQEIAVLWPYYRFLKPVRGVARVLRELRGQGLILGVLANTLPSLRESLAYHGLDLSFQHFFASSRMGVAKPDPRAFELAVAQMGLTLGEVIYVGDSPRDVEAARGLGMPAYSMQSQGIPDPRNSLHLLWQLEDLLPLVS